MELDANSPVAVVTGASAGIGKSTAGKLVAMGWQVIGVGRDPGRCAIAEAEIAESAGAGGRFIMLRGNFDLMADVQRVATEITELTDRVQVLINNAGGVRDQRIVTTEGTEATFAANHLAPFVLTRELMPLLVANTAGSIPGSTRVIAVSSNAHKMSRGIDWDDMQSLTGFRSAAAAYGQAKLANILFTRELARRVAADGIIAQVMHPGVVASNFASHGDEYMQAHMASADTVSPDEPAETLCWLATDPECGHNGGRYFHRKHEEQPTAVALDDVAAARLWIESEKLLATLGI
ncbi:UNVERIFIED_CONTAM: NAD(P)-dependent dehydrogenase (short-subunit alcohol dehydrogenase family) [Williamsia faeni]